jgi:hypothetical protein
MQLYIGDGVTVTQSFIRKRGKTLIGHSRVRTQLTRCQKEGVPREIITHCGSEIVTGDERKISEFIAAMDNERGLDTRLAYHGMKLTLLCAVRALCEKRRGDASQSQSFAKCKQLYRFAVSAQRCGRCFETAASPYTGVVACVSH